MKKYIIAGVLILTTGILGAVVITRDDKSVSVDRLTIDGDGKAVAEYKIYPTGNSQFAVSGSVEVNLPNKAAILAEVLAAIKVKEDLP